MIAWATHNALAASILIVAVLAIRRPVANAFGARAAYALWLAPAARAVLPPMSMPAAALPIGAPVGGTIDVRLMTAAIENQSVLSWSRVAVAIWLGGAALYLAFNWWRHHRFLEDALANGTPLIVPEIGQDVVASSSVDGPLATGLVHPLILVPADFEQRFTPEQQSLALLHEQAHHRRGDIWASLAAMLVTAFLWFNPFAHMALRAFRRDMEAACDARVIAEAGADTATPYAETILRCVGRPAPRSLCALTAVDELKGRLQMLGTTHGQMRKVAGLLIAGGLTVAGLAVAAPALADDPKADDGQKTRRIEIREVIGDEKGEPTIVRRSGDDSSEAKLDCPGEKFDASSEGGNDGRQEKTRFVLCADKGESLLSALERAAGSIEKRDEMPAESKAEILAKIRAKIAELRAKG
jgi:beta-lactamase regulating signal transducer with metallopeptidase domain